MEARRSIFGINADWQAIALCLVAAGTFWFFNAMNEDHTADVSYPVKFVYDQDIIVPVEPLPARVLFNASGFGWNLLRRTLKINRKPILIKVSNLPSDKYIAASDLLPIVKSQLDDIKINYLLKDTIFLRFDKIIEKPFPLRVDSSAISLLPGNEIVSAIRIEPEFVKVTGPSSVIKSLKDSFYIRIPERNIEAPYDAYVNLAFELPRQTTFKPKEVKVRFDVAAFVQETIGIIPVLKGFRETETDIGERVKLTVLIRPEDIERLKNEELEVIINRKDLDRTDSTLPLKLVRQPDYIREYFFTPSVIPISELE